MQLTKKVKIIAVFEIITAFGLVLFWVGFFIMGYVPQNTPACYVQHEHSFLLPDIILATLMLMGGILTLKEYPGGKTIAHACAGALIFLGILDFSFNYQNGIYALSTLDALINGFINLWCASFGLTVIIGTLD